MIKNQLTLITDKYSSGVLLLVVVPAFMDGLSAVFPPWWSLDGPCFSLFSTGSRELIFCPYDDDFFSLSADFSLELLILGAEPDGRRPVLLLLTFAPVDVVLITLLLDITFFGSSGDKAWACSRGEGASLINHT